MLGIDKSNRRMVGRVILNKLPECIFEIFEITRKKQRQFEYFKKSQPMIYPKDRPNQTCG